MTATPSTLATRIDIGPRRFLIASNDPRPTLAIFNDQSFAVSDILLAIARPQPRGSCSAVIESWSLGGRGADALHRWGRKRAFRSLELIVPARVAASGAARKLRDALVAVTPSPTHRKRLTVTTPDGEWRIFPSQNLEDAGCASLETALVLPPTAHSHPDYRHGWTIDADAPTGGCFGDAIRKLAADSVVDIASWDASPDEVRRLADAGIRVRQLHLWRSTQRVQTRNRANRNFDGLCERLVLGLSHAKFATDGHAAILTSANLTRNTHAETILHTRERSVVQALETVFAQTRHADGLRTRSDLDTLLARAKRRLELRMRIRSDIVPDADADVGVDSR